MIETDPSSDGDGAPISDDRGQRISTMSPNESVAPPDTPSTSPSTPGAGASTAETDLTGIDDAGQVIIDTPCRRCGYNLRGLMRAGVCPECESPIVQSHFSGQLRFADPRWLARLVLGARLLIVAAIAGTAVSIALFALFWFASPEQMARLQLGSQIGTGLLTVLWTVAVLLVTAPEPRATLRKSTIVTRRITRWCTVVSVIAAPLHYFRGDSFVMVGATTASMRDLLIIEAILLANVLSVIGSGVGLLYLRSLAQRIPADGLARQSHLVAWGYLATAGALAICNGLIMLLLEMNALSPIDDDIVFISLQIINAAFGLGTLIFSLWGFVLLIRYAAAFRRVRAQAEAVAQWSAESPTAITEVPEMTLHAPPLR